MIDPITFGIITWISLFSLATGVRFMIKKNSLSKIEKIFYRKMSKIKKKNIKKYEDEECVICQEDFKLKDKLIKLYCGHFYHKDCIDQWLREDNKNFRCPLCNLPLMTKFGIRINHLIE